jgi:hypothetical protein
VSQSDTLFAAIIRRAFYMKNFFVRVELAGTPNPDTHTAVHALMAKNGFFSTLQGYDPTAESQHLRLPGTLYYGAQISDVTSIRDSLFQQLEELAANPTVLVIESAHWAFRD